MAEFVYKQKVVLTRGFYAGRRGRVMAEMNKNPDEKSYTVEVELGDEAPKKIEVRAIDMRKHTFMDYIL